MNADEAIREVAWLRDQFPTVTDSQAKSWVDRLIEKEIAIIPFRYAVKVFAEQNEHVSVPRLLSLIYESSKNGGNRKEKAMDEVASLRAENIRLKRQADAELCRDRERILGLSPDERESAKSAVLAEHPDMAPLLANRDPLTSPTLAALIVEYLDGVRV